jgi:L-iduronidase
VQNQTDPVLAAFVSAWDAATAGIEDAEDATGAKLFFGGTASGRAAGDVYFLPAVLEHAASGRNAFNGNAVRLDWISAHVKGESTSYVTVEGEWAVSALIRAHPSWAAAGLGALPLSNDEGDPMVGWETPEDWRGDARYAAIIPKMVNQHLLSISDNATANNPLGWLSFDGAFMNGVGDVYTGFGQRTMTARFGTPASRGPFAFVRKSGLAAFALLSRLGDTRCAVAGADADVLHANAGALASSRMGTTGPGGDAAQAAVLIYNSADCEPDSAPAVDVAVTLAGLPFVGGVPADGSVVAVPYLLDQNLTRNPAGLWSALGSPALPSGAQLAQLWAAAAAMTAPAGSPVAVAVGQGGVVTLPRFAQLALPGLLLWHIAERASAPPAPVPPPRVDAFVKAANASFIAGGAREVLVRWACAQASRVVGAYVVQAAPSAAGPWATVNAGAPADFSCSFSLAAGAALAEGSAWRFAGVDYWGRQGAFSAPAVAVPWPAWGSA